MVDYSNTYFNQRWVLKEIKKYFSLDELFEPKMLKRYSSDQLWSFLDPRLLSNLLFIRVTRGYRITVNTKAMKQRGFRSILSKIVLNYALKGRLYASAHTRGGAVDFNEEGCSAENTRNWIEQNARRMPYPCRLEWLKDGVPISWCHIDVDFFPNNPKVYKFNV